MTHLQVVFVIAMHSGSEVIETVSALGRVQVRGTDRIRISIHTKHDGNDYCWQWEHD